MTTFGKIFFPHTTTIEERLPERTVIRYEDENGEWRNEYDDEGYEFDPNRYEGQDEEEEFYTEEELLRVEEELRQVLKEGAFWFSSD